ncbi:MAG: T9SS type A sorting domain-containing protein [Saprospiraceae bacterium]|nr:T9SS type A sorting domain-containing protein [Saprospiraceae bacterium]
MNINAQMMGRFLAKAMLIGCMVFSLNTYSQNIKLNTSEASFTINNSSYTELNISTSFTEIRLADVVINEKLFHSIEIEGYGSSFDVGKPQLPIMHRLIEIPLDANISIEIVSYNLAEYKLSDYNINTKIFPAQPPIPKIENYKSEFKLNQTIYSTNGFYSQELVSVDKLGIMRGVNLGRLNISPIQYNPVTNTIKVYNDLCFKIHFVEGNISKTKEMKINAYSPYFSSLESSIINYQPLASNSKDTLTKYPVKYVIVSNPMFQSLLAPFVAWKTKKGFNVIEAYTNSPNVGSTTTSIKSYLDSLYNAGTVNDPAPTFILIVGDVAQVPAFSGIQTTGSHVSDFFYAEYTGDTLPEAYIGRFSASTLPQLASQIDKTLQYEQFLMPDSSFLDTAVMISGVDAQNAPIYGNGHINYATSNYVNLAHGLNTKKYLHPSSGSAASQIIQDVNNGACIVNYTAHGSTYGWSNPSFNTSNILTLTNENKYPLMIGNACSTNEFNNAECFGEALLRANKKGAIGYIGAANLSYWDEDYYWAVGFGSIGPNPTYAGTGLGAYDRLFHDHGEPQSEWYVTQAQIMVGGNLAVTQSASNIRNYYWEIYHLMGDPSLMPYLGIPSSLNVTYNPVLPLSLSSFTVNTEPNAYVGISMNGVLHGAGLADSNGVANININPFTSPGIADIVASKHNRKPFTGTVVVGLPNGPYIVFQDRIIRDNSGNNNGKADFGESIVLDVTLNNLTNFSASQVIAKITSTDTNIVIVDSLHNWGSIAANDSSKQSGAFSFMVNNIVLDQHIVQFQIHIEDSLSNQWNSVFSVVLNAPLLRINSFVIDDNTSGNGNGKLDIGETVDIIINTSNNGHADAINSIGTLMSSNSLITVSGAHNFNTLAIGANANASFTVSVGSATWNGSTTMFEYNVSSGNYYGNESLQQMVGIIDEDFETSDFTKYSWNSGGILPWTIIDASTADSTQIFEGIYSAKSGPISHDETSELSIQMDVIVDDTISFYKKVSCEEDSYGNDYDYLEFKIDNTSIARWDGIDNWSREVFHVSKGQHTFKWIYAKDNYYSEGSDCAWIDYIVFPQNSLLSTVKTLNNDLNDFLVNVFPNPANDVINLTFKLEEKTPLTIRIYNINGQFVKLLMNEATVNNGNHNLSYNISELNKGVYYIIFNTKNSTTAKKLIIAE